jgi:DNA mismatch repair ATPase MutS
MVTVPPPETAEQTLPGSRTDSDVLLLDAHTLKDLEIFQSETGESCLFQFCNLTRTAGGARVLRQRMENPWSNAERIHATQESLSFILAKRQAFTKLPSAYTTTRVDHYAHEVLPMVVQDNLLEFSLGAFSLWASHDRHYMSIVLGVQFTSGLISSLRDFVEQVELASPVGELAPLIEEMRTLLARARLSQVPDRKIGRWAWQILRVDQVFRLHEQVAMARLLQIIFEIDALVAMADVTSKYGFILPQIEEGSLHVHAEGLVHPFIQNAVANPVNLNQERRLLFLTGPNMAGKTTYLRAFATALYFAHLGMGVPASSFRFVPAQRLFSSISLNDDLSGGVSYFRAEALRVKAVAKAVADGYRVVALMDEPFKGTNVKDAFDASLAIMERFATKQDCLFMFSSHLIELSEQLSVVGQIDCCYFDAEEREERLRFDYLLRQGVSNQRLGMRVLREEGIFELLDRSPVEE